MSHGGDQNVLNKSHVMPLNVHKERDDSPAFLVEIFSLSIGFSAHPPLLYLTLTTNMHALRFMKNRYFYNSVWLCI